MSRTPHHALRRIGSTGIALALITLGLAVGVALSAPAGATSSDSIQVRMAGDTGFSSTGSQPLIDVADLAPGASVEGLMEVRDNSTTDLGSGVTDSLVLTMVHVVLTDACAAGGSTAAGPGSSVASSAASPDCAGSGAALAQALTFTLEVTDPATGATLLVAPESVALLRSGVTLASGLTSGRTVGVRLLASLPADAGNDIAYGDIGFDLQLGLITSVTQTAGTGSGSTSTSVATGTTAAGQTSAASVGETSSEPSTGVAASATHSAGSTAGLAATTTAADPSTTEVVVLGQDPSLSHTGVAVGPLVALGLLMLGAGLALFLVGRSARHQPPSDSGSESR